MISGAIGLLIVYNCLCSQHLSTPVELDEPRNTKAERNVIVLQGGPVKERNDNNYAVTTADPLREIINLSRNRRQLSSSQLG